MIFCSNGQDCMLDILVLIYLSLVQGFVKIRRIVVLISNTNADEFCNCVGEKKWETIKYKYK